MMQRRKAITSLPTKAAPVIDDYHGHKITDPYRWLEDAGAAETQQFVDQQNAGARRVLDLVPGREKLRARIEQLLIIGRMASPRLAGNHYFYERRDGRQNQPVIYLRDFFRPITSDGVDGHNCPPLASQSGGANLEPDRARDHERALIDVNALAPDGTISLDWWFPSERRQLCCLRHFGQRLRTEHVVLD